MDGVWQMLSTTIPQKRLSRSFSDYSLIDLSVWHFEFFILFAQTWAPTTSVYVYVSVCVCDVLHYNVVHICTHSYCVCQRQNHHFCYWIVLHLFLSHYFYKIYICKPHTEPSPDLFIWFGSVLFCVANCQSNQLIIPNMCSINRIPITSIRYQRNFCVRIFHRLLDFPFMKSFWHNSPVGLGQSGFFPDKLRRRMTHKMVLAWAEYNLTINEMALSLPPPSMCLWFRFICLLLFN